jgi:catechol 2,3-dioxygenase-like lactoylglutathione lyase family enzyme
MAATPFAQHCYFLNTSDLEATANFYSGIIGLPVVFEQPGFVKFFQVAPQAFLGVCMRGSRDPADVKGAIPTFVCATPAEVDRWQCTMEQHGIEIEKRAGSGISSDGKHLPTLYNLFVRDPAGYLIEFQAFLDPAWPSAGLPPPIAAVAARLDGLVAQSASEVVAQLRAGTVTPAQCVDAFAAQHRASEAAVNAVPILCLERARKAAAAIGAPPSDPPPPGWLYGLPVVIKDLDAVEGVRFTQGSPIYRERVASQSSAVVQQLERRGAIVVGKSNTPEFGAGSHTFNPVFGPTVTPFDVRRTAGGSSGGAAASLASGVGWLASGSDLGGSLRIPASFCGVCGFRVSPGRVARDPSTPSGPFVALHSITGPMARSVQVSAEIGSPCLGSCAHSTPISCSPQ